MRREPDLSLARAVQKYERSGMSLGSALRTILFDQSAGWMMRGSATQLLPVGDSERAIGGLLDLFFKQTDKIELWETALTIEHSGEQSAVPRLVEALYDVNPERRQAAARALGWLWPVSPRAAKALIRALLDKSQPQPVREEAAESLAYSHYSPAIQPLASVLEEHDVRMRFWAVFALGGIGEWRVHGDADAGVVEALERMIPDNEVAPGWWSVGQEALAMLGKLDPQYGAKLDAETRRVLGDPNSSSEDLRWAGGYSLP
jgi:HEAT repeat protein